VISSDLATLAPEILAVFAGTILLIGFSAARSRRGPRALLLAASAGVLAVLAATLLAAGNGTFSDGMLVSDPFSRFFRYILLAAIGCAVVFSSRSREVPERIGPEYHAFLLYFFAAASLMTMANNILLLFLSMEVLSILSYVGVSMNLGVHRSTEAGIKYVIYGAVATAIMLFGVSFLYGMTGSLDYAAIRGAIRNASPDSAVAQTLAVLTIGLILAGFFFKLAAVPFYAWAPDAYEGGPTPFVALLSVASKAAAVGALVRLLFTVFASEPSPGVYRVMANADWRVLIGAVAAVTMTFGNLAAIPQRNLKRLLAYSSIAHAGYLLMGISALSSESVSAVLIYLVAYLIMNLGAFFCVQIVGDAAGDEDISRFEGLARQSPLVSACFAAFLLSLTGIPPFVGFVGKFYIFAAVIRQGGPGYILLAIIGGLNSVVALFYYARIIRAMYLTDRETAPLPVGWLRASLICGLGAAVVLFGIFWSALLDAVLAASTLLK